MYSNKKVQSREYSNATWNQDGWGLLKINKYISKRESKKLSNSHRTDGISINTMQCVSPVQLFSSIVLQIFDNTCM